MTTEREKVKVQYTPAFQTYHSAGDEAEPYCPECDADLSYDEYNYCPWCGVELDWEPEKDSKDITLCDFPFERDCPECGGQGDWFDDIMPGFRECPRCQGTGKVKESDKD